MIALRERMDLILPEPKNVRNVAVLCHRHADADTYLSAYVLSFILQRLSLIHI